MATDQRSFCGDERVEILTQADEPYRWICGLTIIYEKDVPEKKHKVQHTYVGTGFRINTKTRRAVVVTAAHNIYLHTTNVDGSRNELGYCKEITMWFPSSVPSQSGQKQFKIGPIKAEDMYVPPDYINGVNRENCNYGLIPFPEHFGMEGFGWTAFSSDKNLKNLEVTVTGFPLAEPNRMFRSVGRLESHTKYEIYYKCDTSPGMFGSPVYSGNIRDGLGDTVIGVHVGRGCTNKAVRFTPEVIFNSLRFIGELHLYNLRGEIESFSDVYLRYALSDEEKKLTKPKGGGFGTVNCQYKPPGVNERFYIIPIAMHSSKMPDVNFEIVALRSYLFENIYLRLHPDDMTATIADGGGGTVNCQWGVGEREIFLKDQPVESDKNIVSFRSIKQSKCFIRMDGTNVNSDTVRRDGGGVVNCQWFDDKKPSLYEKFVLIR